MALWAMTAWCWITTARAEAPVVLIGVDGADLGVVETLWERGELPHLRELAERGVHGRLQTPYNKSPIIWTTVATGHAVEQHGVADFLATTDEGDRVPVGSSNRQVEALWTMLPREGRSTLVLGWWASWPAERIDGLMVSDRLQPSLTDRTWPPEAVDELHSWRKQAQASWQGVYGDEHKGRADQLHTWLATEHVDDGYDLAMVYLHQIDIASHRYWRYWQPEHFASVTPAQLDAYADAIPAAYRAMDSAVGAIVAVAPADARILVVSDHGFGPAEQETVGFRLDMTAIFEALRLHATPMSRANVHDQLVRLDGVPEHLLERELRRASEALGSVTWLPSGAPVFDVQRSDEDGAHLLAQVRTEGHGDRLAVNGAEVPGAIGEFWVHSGQHGHAPPGIFFAAGPGIREGVRFDEASIFDITPTVLALLELPYGRDMAGQPLASVLTEAQLATSPVRSIPTWEGAARETHTERSAMDAQLMEELRSLGYIE